MGLIDALKEVIDELDRTHPDGTYDFEASRHDGLLPNFATSQSGYQRHFTKKALAALRSVASTIHSNEPGISSVIELENFENRVRQCITDLHADGQLRTADLEQSRKIVKAWISGDISSMRKTFTHYFPAWTLGMERDQPFQIGPVKYMTRSQWIDSVQFSDSLQEKYLNQRETNLKWKELLKDALNKTTDGCRIDGLAGALYPAIRDCPSVLKVTIVGYEKDLSRKVAEIVCKSALDSVSLVMGGGDFFHQQVLCNERLQPVRSSSIFETDGHLWLPGSRIGPRFQHQSYDRITSHLSKRAGLVAAIGRILEAAVNPYAFPHPNLSKRWATALDWLAEGSRETNDAVAVAKLGTSLDVLACGGKRAGILGMLKHLTGWSDADVITTGDSPQTLSEVVRDVYDNGRSQILHGTHFDRLKSFTTQRGLGASLARLALIVCADRLTTFAGADGDQEFRSIP
jgi:hypothetical protein